MMINECEGSKGTTEQHRVSNKKTITETTEATTITSSNNNRKKKRRRRKSSYDTKKENNEEEEEEESEENNSILRTEIVQHKISKSRPPLFSAHSVQVESPNNNIIRKQHEQSAQGTKVKSKLVRSSTSNEEQMVANVTTNRTSEKEQQKQQQYSKSMIANVIQMERKKDEMQKLPIERTMSRSDNSSSGQQQQPPLILVDATSARGQHAHQRILVARLKNENNDNARDNHTILIKTATINNYTNNNNNNDINDSQDCNTDSNSTSPNNNNNNNNPQPLEDDETTTTHDCSVNNVDHVKRHFITLINHNQLLYFYLGTIIFSLLIVCYTSIQLLRNTNSELSVSKIECKLQAQHWIFKPLPQSRLLLLLGLSLPFTIGLTLITAYTSIKFGSNLYEEKHQHEQKQHKINDELAINTDVKQTSTNEKTFNTQLWLSDNSHQLIGVTIALLLLYLPIIIPSFPSSNISALQSTNSSALSKKDLSTCLSEFAATDGEAARAWLSSVSSLLLIIYLQPFYLNFKRAFIFDDGEKRASSKNVGKIFYVICYSFCLVWPYLSLLLASYMSMRKHKQQSSDRNTTGQQLELSEIILVLVGCPLALLMGNSKRCKLARTVSGDTFDGATELIEAKVSLEHQRQQQETLLLSVLPAYVAEQVKRNMLKKTTTVSVIGQGSINDLHHQPHYQDIHYNQNNHHHSHVNSLTFSWNQTSHKNASIDTDHHHHHQQQQQHALENQQQSKLEQNVHDGLSPKIKLHDSSTTDNTSSSKSPKLKNRSFFYNGIGSIHSDSATLQLKINCDPANASQTSTSTIVVPTTTIATSAIPNIISHPPSASRRGFNELYIRTYNNVSLLYGDIVGFTRLCTQLSSSQLVRVLNDLFSHFDYLADKHKIMRIKILGDCYYGVSGIPEFAVMGAKSRAGRNDNHATNCVNMGLDMIHYIRCLNIERASKGSAGNMPHSISVLNEKTTTTTKDNQNNSRSTAVTAITDNNNEDMNRNRSCSKSVGSCTPLPPFELNMRIGIHTGHIHSGVIGLKKWQFDVWSNDVSIAMHCESSGQAGRVQVTEATVQQLNGAFTYEESSGCQRDVFLASRDIKTYLICDRISSLGVELRRQEELILENKNRLEKKKRLQQQQQHQRHSDSINNSTNKQEALDEDNIRAATIGTIKQTLLAGELCNSSASNTYGLAFNHQDIRPFTLSYRDSTISKIYSNSKFSDDNNNKNNSTLMRSSECKTNIRLLTELVGTIFLLVIVYTLMTAHLLLPRAINNQHLGTTILVLISLSAILLLVSLLPLDRHRIREIVVKELSIREEKLDELENVLNLDQNEQSYQKTCNPQQVIKDKQSENNWFTTKSPIMCLVRKQLSSFQKQLLELISLLTENVLILNKKTTSLVTVLMFIIVILTQFYIIYTYYSQKPQILEDVLCNKNSEDVVSQLFQTKTKEHLSAQQYQLAVIILLITIDFNTSLSGYNVKCILILLTIGIQLSFHITRFSSKSHYNQELYKNCSLDKPLELNKKNYYLDNSSSVALISYLMNGSPYTLNQQLIEWSTNALIFIVSLWSLAFARQLEYTNKANFLWRNRLNVDHEELEYISGINKVLLENILPSHVVQYYLTHPNGQQNANNNLPILQPYMRMSFSNIRNQNNELYHEQHDSVAVMFASIPHFYEFYDESDISKQGLGCIALLNEIICDFDKLLLKNKFSRIEKIKTIGSTYMAAAGLRPQNLTGPQNSACHTPSVSPAPQVCAQSTSNSSNMWKRNIISRSNHNLGSSCNSLNIKQQASSLSTLNNVPTDVGQSSNEKGNNTDLHDDRRSSALNQQKLNLICMIQFATSLMSALNGINKQSFQLFRLRIGVNTGSVIAGVIGAQRPFYDIWGDCVNIASRMESLGEVGRIQVEEKTAQILMESLCPETYSLIRRGPIDVKGKGGMVTYFVDRRVSTSDQQQQQWTQAAPDQQQNQQLENQVKGVALGGGDLVEEAGKES